MAQLTNSHLVFYFLSDVSAADHKLLLLRDFRSTFAASKTRYFVFKKNSQTKALGLHESYDCPDFLLKLENYFFAAVNTVTQIDQCLLKAVMQCCQLNFSQDVSFVGDIADTNHLLLVSEQIHSVLQKSILIVGYRGVSGKLPSVKTSLNNLTRPQKCIFETLALIASAQQMASMKNLNIKNFD